MVSFQQRDEHIFFFEIKKDFETNAWKIIPRMFDLNKKEDHSHCCHIQTINYTSKNIDPETKAYKGQPFAVLFVKKLKNKNQHHFKEHEQLSSDQLIAIIEKSIEDQNEIRIG